MTTPNLGLTESTVGVDTGANAASREQTNINLIDLHDHTTGKGVRIPTGGLNINADLPFNANSATELESLQLESQASNILVANTIFVKNGELYYVDASLNVVQLTQSGGVSVTTLSSGAILLDAGNSRGANLRFGTNDSYAAIIETNNTDRFTINSSGLATALYDFGIAKGADNSSTGTLNDVSTSGKSYFSFTGGSATTVTGFANGADGKLLYILNKTGSQLTINNNDSASVAANRILTGTGAPISIENNASLVLIYDAVTALWTVVGGTGGGSSGLPVYTINLASGSLYNDSAAAPVDGTGGTPTGMTYAVETSSPLRGAVSYKLSKDAANRQGCGVAFDLTIDSVDKSTIQSINFDISASANFVSGDASLYVYDVTNGVMLPIVSVLPTGTSAQFSRAVALTTGTSYRILLHVASTSALAYDLTIDAMTVNSIIRPQAQALSDWISYTPTISAGFGTATNVSARYKREGDSLRGIVSFTAGTLAASIGTITLPTGLTLDSNKLTFNNTDTNPGNVVGTWSDNRASANVSGLIVTAPATSTSVVYFAPQAVSGVSHLTPASNTSTQITGTGAVVACEFIVPIANWSSNITLSSTNGAIEYVSNSSATDADDTTSFVDGASGSAGIVGTTALTAPRKKRVSFKTPLQPTDRVQIEFIDTSISGAQWQPLGSGIIPTRGSSLPIQPPNQANSVLSGIGLIPVSSTQYDVWFGNTANTAAGVYGAAGSAWTTFTSFKWRVAKYSAIGAAELAPATVSSQGTVGYSQWTNAGLVAGDFTSFGTPTAIDVRYRREGDSLRMTGVFTLGTATGVVSSVNLPTINGSALTIDTTKIFNSAATTSGAGYLCGRYICSTALSPVPYGVMTLNAGTSTTKVYFGRIQTTTTNDYLTPSASGGNLGSSGDKVQFECLIPILGWS